MNVRFNFKVPVAKRNRALAYFAAISLLSAGLNMLLRREFQKLGGSSYEADRFLTAGILFGLAYFFHRRLSFADRKRVGVAIYANGIEDIKSIWHKIGAYPDFIHVDLIDETFNKSASDVRSYRLETVGAFWLQHKIHVHMMTRRPLSWLPEVLQYADTVIVHAEIDDNLQTVLDSIRDAGKSAGLCLKSDTPVETARPYLKDISLLMLLAIAQPGESGQQFEISTLERIEQIARWPERPHFSLCVDGGVNETNVRLINVEFVVSGSSVLMSKDPRRQIMRLQTSSSYEAT